jgi:DnaJ homolog subfamily C member 11
MVDTASSRTSTNNDSSRRSRGQPVSRNSSARSSAAYHDDYLLPQGHGVYGAPSLRSVSSRFSLREQFATTRKDYEFGFDDASLFERSTLASEAVGDVSEGLTLLGPVIDPSSALQGRGGFDYYDLLVLPPNPSPQAIRRAYYRLFVLLYPNSHPPRSRSAARAYLDLVQTAFETLINPERRLMIQLDGSSPPSTSPDENIFFQHRHRELLRYLLYEQAASDHGSLELGLQLHGGPTAHLSTASAKGSRPLLNPLDFVMSQSFTTPLPDLEELFGRVARLAAILVAQVKAKAYGLPQEQSDDHDKLPQPLTLASQRTFLTIKGSVYGLVEEITSLPGPVLADPYHPCIPTHVPRERALQLLDGRIQPRITVKIQHELPPSVAGQDESTKSSGIYGPGAIVELESEILPDPALAVGVSKEVTLPRDSRPSLLQLSARCSPWNRSLPRIGATLQRPWIGGFVQCKVESGDWALQPDQTCRPFTQVSVLSRRLVNLSPPMRLTPRIELSYRAPSSLESATASLADRSPTQSLRDLDARMGRHGGNTQGFWTLSTTAEPHCLGASLKYGVDASRLYSQLDALIRRDTTAEAKATHLGKGVRMEAELVSSTLWSRFIALRCLKRIGRFSKVGLEFSMGTYNLHLALYWSRLGQSVRLPILVSSGSSFSPRLLFWTTVVPFSGLAVWECAQYWRQRVGSKRRARNGATQVQERRAEADDLAILLSFNVENRQEVEREEHGLVILSAKYGVKTGESWGLEEVADVTTAVGALVDDGQLYIPSNVNKSNILGFWDPAPHATKTLHVRYQFQGKEGTVEVIGQEPLSLPLRARPRELA